MEARLETKEEAIRNLQQELKEIKMKAQTQETKDTTTRTRKGRPPNTEEQEDLQKIEKRLEQGHKTVEEKMTKRIALLEQRLEETQGGKGTTTAQPRSNSNITTSEEELHELATELKNKFTFILGAAHQAAFKRLPRRSK